MKSGYDSTEYKTVLLSRNSHNLRFNLIIVLSRSFIQIIRIKVHGVLQLILYTPSCVVVEICWKEATLPVTLTDWRPIDKSNEKTEKLIKTERDFRSPVRRSNSRRAAGSIPRGSAINTKRTVIGYSFMESPIRSLFHQSTLKTTERQPEQLGRRVYMFQADSHRMQRSSLQLSQGVAPKFVKQHVTKPACLKLSSTFKNIIKTSFLTFLLHWLTVSQSMSSEHCTAPL